MSPIVFDFFLLAQFIDQASRIRTQTESHRGWLVRINFSNILIVQSFIYFLGVVQADNFAGTWAVVSSWQR